VFGCSDVQVFKDPIKPQTTNHKPHPVIRSSFVWAFLLLMAVACHGCAPSAPKSKLVDKVKPILKQPLTVVTPDGEATERSNGPGREPLYHVTWRNAKVDVSDKGPFAGRMEGVKGEMYHKGQVSNTFGADYANADRNTRLLTLTGHVQLISKADQIVLTCDKVEWLVKEKIVKATGHVKAVGNFGSVGVADELWATPDLKVIATPDSFKP
jgi:hypothetical protein